MIAKLLATIFGTANSREIKKLQPIVDQINALEPKISALSIEQLAAKTNEFKGQIAQGKSLDDILPEAFAVVRETAKRTLGQRHYDVQLIGGIVLHQGKIAEMKTGEGKTLTATLPLYLNALTGKGVHLVTVNDYLAKRDSEWMAPIYNTLGLSVGCLQHSISDTTRKDIYQKDILFAKNSELGFDYLRDNMKYRVQDYIQRNLNYAIVDEVDSILIDEARTPLIISGDSEDSGEKLYQNVDIIVSALVKNTDYEIDEKSRTVVLTESGNDKLEKFFNIKNIYDLENLQLVHIVYQSLKAHALFKKDVDYVVKDGQISIVDEYTGRILAGRRYSDGLHQAIEAKENVEIANESQTLASITLQNFFRLYKKLGGMTGTAATEAEEFHKIYNLGVVSIPTNQPLIRLDRPDLIFLNKNAKYKAIIEDVKEHYKKKQPVLIGTIAIETSEMLSNIFTKNGIIHDVLNAKNHAREAEIIASAGQPGHVTIATNMAGRGTDIKLSPEAVQAGGLYILGTERHENRRIDNQLRGRSGRQGDPGESRFFISLEDDLIIRFGGGESLKKTMEWAGMNEEETLESKMVSNRIEKSQEMAEKRNFSIRKNVLEYDDVLNQQRTVIYKIRKEVLIGADNISELISDMIADNIEDLVAVNSTGRIVSDENLQNILNNIANIINTDVAELQEFGKTLGSNLEVIVKNLIEFLINRYNNLYINSEHFDKIRQAHKWIMLETIDHSWKQHMLNLSHLEEGIGLRGFGQKNPLIEYKREAFDMFEEMMRSVKEELVKNVFQLNISHFDTSSIERRRQRELDRITFSGGEEIDGASHTAVAGKVVHTQAQSDKIGRNVDCPCGSSKKSKKCCNK